MILRSVRAVRGRRSDQSQLVYVCGSHGNGGWMGAGMELVLGKNAVQSHVVGRMSGDTGAFLGCVGNTLITLDRTTIHVRSSG